MANYLTYPVKTMRITQNYNESYSHAVNSTGSPADYPIDEAAADTTRSFMFCPCDEMKITRIYGVGSKGTNTIWLTSTTKVNMPCGEDVVTLMIIHPNDDDLSKLKVGQTFKRGEPMFREGNDGGATGYHFHMSFGKGTIKGNGWVQNNKKAWVINTTGGAIKPEEACYLDKAITVVNNSQGITFKAIPASAKPYKAYGIDVSKHQRVINWSKVKESGVTFAIIRAGFGNSKSQVDPMFATNVEGALAAGLNVGAYWFSYAYNITMVKQEAKLFNEVLSPYKGKLTFPVIYDFEYDSVNYAKRNGVTITKTMATDFALTFCKEMENYGWYSMNYTNLEYYNNYFDKTQMKIIDTWYANWSISSPNISCGIWQYTNKANINGISGNVDADYAYRDYPNIIKNAGLNGFSKTSNEVNDNPHCEYEDMYEKEKEFNEILQAEKASLENRNQELTNQLAQLNDKIAQFKEGLAALVAKL